jgi:hypothetical protein
MMNETASQFSKLLDRASALAALGTPQLGIRFQRIVLVMMSYVFWYIEDLSSRKQARHGLGDR